jgi:hypothetical protein
MAVATKRCCALFGRGQGWAASSARPRGGAAAGAGDGFATHLAARGVEQFRVAKACPGRVGRRSEGVGLLAQGGEQVTAAAGRQACRCGGRDDFAQRAAVAVGEGSGDGVVPGGAVEVVRRRAARGGRGGFGDDLGEGGEEGGASGFGVALRREHEVGGEAAVAGAVANQFHLREDEAAGAEGGPGGAFGMAGGEGEAAAVAGAGRGAGEAGRKAAAEVGGGLARGQEELVGDAVRPVTGPVAVAPGLLGRSAQPGERGERRDGQFPRHRSAARRPGGGGARCPGAVQGGERQCRGIARRSWGSSLAIFDWRFGRRMGVAQAVGIMGGWRREPASREGQAAG